MSTPLSVDSINLDRDDLAGFLPNLRSIKAFENLAKLASSTLPDAVNDNVAAIDDLQGEVGTANASALAAVSEALIARALAQDAQIEAMSSQLSSLRAELAAARTAINDLQTGVLQ
jgi:hypothetical protein